MSSNENDTTTLTPPNPPSRPQSHQSGTITNHWNDLPENLIPTSSSSRTSSRSATPQITSKLLLQDDNNNNPNRYPSPLSTIAVPDGSNSRFGKNNDTEGELQELSVLLPGLYNLPTGLSKGEHTMMQNRLNKILLGAAAAGGNSGLKESQEMFLRELLQSFVVKRDVTPAEVREELVSFMMREQGVAAWAASVRRLAESVIVQS